MDHRVPAEFQGRSIGYTAAAVVSEASGGVQMGFRLARIEAGGSVDSHVHSFEESIYVIDGSLVVDTPEGSVELAGGDYGLLPVGTTHAPAAGAFRIRHSVPSASPDGTCASDRRARSAHETVRTHRS
jgi:quercetin dioxygenase-like cupin family protein